MRRRRCRIPRSFIAAGLVRKGPALAPETVAPIESGRPRAPIHVELVKEGKTL
jgi:hypothetical protein